MLTGSHDARFRGKTGSHGQTVKTTQMAQAGHFAVRRVRQRGKLDLSKQW